MSHIVKTNVAAGSTIYTDGLEAFTGLKAAGYRHVALKQPLRSALRKGAASVVPLADQVVGNLQDWRIGTHHGVSRPSCRRTPMSSCSVKTLPGYVEASN